MRYLIMATAMALLAANAYAEPAKNACSHLPNHQQLTAALKKATAEKNGGLSLPMWGTLVDRSGIVCAVAYTGNSVDAQWPGSRVISAQKANTANAFSLVGLAISTANLYSAVQPGGSLFGLQESNPVNINVAYAGHAEDFGSVNDPLVNNRIGGVNVFGGGLALYNEKGEIIGGLGVSGDTSCADHNIAWRARNNLQLDYVPAGVAADKTDQIIYDITNNKSAGGYGHPNCGGSEHTIAASLPAVSSHKK
ncbi:MAG: GlcG/HbpS family heme-binding protein [Alphaproteobacteria bacterium]